MTTRAMVDHSFFSLLNLISPYSTRLCAPCGSKPYGPLRIRIEIVLPLPPKMGLGIACRTNNEPLQARNQAAIDQTMIKRNILV